jgi:hypothetical protein
MLVPTVSATTVAGTSGASVCQAMASPRVDRGTPVATSAAYARRRATMPSTNATMMPAAVMTTATATATLSRSMVLR